MLCFFLQKLLPCASPPFLAPSKFPVYSLPHHPSAFSEPNGPPDSLHLTLQVPFSHRSAPEPFANLTCCLCSSWHDCLLKETACLGSYYSHLMRFCIHSVLISGDAFGHQSFKQRWNTSCQIIRPAVNKPTVVAVHHGLQNSGSISMCVIYTVMVYCVGWTELIVTGNIILKTNNRRLKKKQKKNKSKM